MAPKIPVVTAKIAVRVGETPMRSAIPIAIGAVTDFGYIAPVMVLSAPSSVAIPTALTIETSPPVTNDVRRGRLRFFRLLKPR